MPAPRYKKILINLYIIIASLGTTTALGANAPSYLFNWGRGAEKVPGAMGVSESIAVDSVNGDVYVNDLYFARIQRFDQDGNYLGEWDCRQCIGLGINTNTHNVIVGKTNEHVIIEYTPDGTEIRRWGNQGTGDGEFNKPRSIAVDSATGNIFIMDILNARVQVFDASGNFLRKWGSKGDGDGQFSGKSGPGALAFDPVARILYVSDTYQNSVQKFDPLGNFLGKWSQPRGFSENETQWIRDIEIGKDGNVYLADADSERIHIFTPGGNNLGTFQGPHNLVDGPFHPRAIAINQTTGNRYVAAAYAHRVDKFLPDNTYITSWGERESDGEVLYYPRGIAVSPVSGEVYVMDTKNYMVKRFSSNGKFLNQWGAASRLGAPGGWGAGLFGFQDNAIAADNAGNIWVAGDLTTYRDPLARIIQQFAADGTFISNWPTADPVAHRDRGIIIDNANDRILVSETKRKRVRIFDTNGGVYGDIAGLESPAGLALHDGFIYVVDTECNCIKKFNPDGGYLTQWGTPGTAPGEFNFHAYSGITTDLLGNIYVADSGNSRIQVFDLNGAFIRVIGAGGSKPGLFARLGDVSISHSYDTLYAVDTKNNRIQAFLLNSASYPDLKGQPTYLPGSEQKAYLWKDFFDGPYHIRIGSNNEPLPYEIKLVSGGPVSDVQEIGLENNDNLNVQGSGFEISATVTSFEDGIDFYLHPGSKTLLGVNLNNLPDPRQLEVGANSQPLAPAGWVIPYNALPDRPGFLGGKDLGLFIGKGRTPGSMEARWNGDGTVHYGQFGLIASQPFLNAEGIQLEQSDKILLDTQSGIEIEGYISSWWDGIDASLNTDSNIGITYQQDGASGSHFVNFGSGSLGIPNAYQVPEMAPYGAPVYQTSLDAGLFLWKDEANSLWHLRATAGGGNARYIGTINSDMPAVSVMPAKLESSDILDTTDLTNISFDLRMSGIWQDGIDFQFPAGARLSISVDAPANAASVTYIGESKWPIQNYPLKLDNW